MDKIRVLIVGGQSRSGLALRALFEGRSEFLPTVLVRRQVAARAGERIVTVSDYFSVPDEILRQTDSVVNLAGVTTGKSRQDFWPPNVEGPLRLAEAAKAAGVRHFLQLSSLSVYGGAEAIGPGTLESPTSPYGQSKLAADRGLLALGDGNFQVTALRVPMIYGRGAGKKLHLLAKLLVRATLLPVPPYAIQRSVVHLENLASAIATVLKARCNGVLFAADPEPLTLELLADVLSQQTGRRIRLITMPAWLFQPLHHVAPGLYDSLYSSSLIEPSACVELSTYGKRSLREGLKDILA